MFPLVLMYILPYIYGTLNIIRLLTIYMFSFISYIFIEYEKNESALEAVTQANNYKLDKQHTFLINLFSDYKK